MPALLLAIVVHEVAHGYVALKFGDNTAEKAGRLSFNPIVHADLLGSVIFPVIGLLLGGVAFGWAKPVPINSNNFTDYRKGMFWVSFAGPLSNFILGAISAFAMAFVLTKTDENFAYKWILIETFNYSILINFILGGFNLIPLFPLDGSKMVSSILKGPALRTYESIAIYGPQIIMGAFLLSMLGIPTISYALIPFQIIAQALKFFFVQILS